MPPLQQSRRLAHRGQVQRPRMVPCVRAQKWVSDRPVIDLVAVLFPFRGESGVKLRWRFFNPQHAHVFGEIRIERPQQCGRLVLRAECGICHLPPRVHAGIGAPGTVDARRVPGNFPQRGLNDFLDGLAIGLQLPARILRPVV